MLKEDRLLQVRKKGDAKCFVQGSTDAKRSVTGMVYCHGLLSNAEQCAAGQKVVAFSHYQ